MGHCVFIANCRGSHRKWCLEKKLEMWFGAGVRKARGAAWELGLPPRTGVGSTAGSAPGPVLSSADAGTVLSLQCEVGLQLVLQVSCVMQAS